MSVICPNCEGWGCASCKSEREAAKGGEQGLSPLEVEVEGLRAELTAAREARDVLRALLPRLVAAARDGYGHAKVQRGDCASCDAILDAEALLAGSPS